MVLQVVRDKMQEIENEMVIANMQQYAPEPAREMGQMDRGSC